LRKDYETIPSIFDRHLRMKKFFGSHWLQFFALFALMLGMAALPESALAGTGGTEFADIYTLLSGWAKGTLGKVIAIGFFLIGVVAGMAQQSVMAAAIGVGAALVMYFGPGVIDNILTAVI
jgi:conjugal transfer pilus assembly protein TraA